MPIKMEWVMFVVNDHFDVEFCRSFFDPNDLPIRP